MKKIACLLVTLIFGLIQFANNIILEDNNRVIPIEYRLSPQDSTFNELINPMNDIKHEEHLLARRKSKMKYHDFKVCWKVFIKNLDKKRINPDQLMLNKKSLIA